MLFAAARARSSNSGEMTAGARVLSCSSVAMSSRRHAIRLPPSYGGNWNRIGGHVESDEASERTISRQFFEETAVRTHPDRWKKYAIMTGDGFEIDVFSRFSDAVLNRVTTKTDEQVHVFYLAHLPHNMISNFKWLKRPSIRESRRSFCPHSMHHENNWRMDC